MLAAASAVGSLCLAAPVTHGSGSGRIEQRGSGSITLSHVPRRPSKLAVSAPVGLVMQLQAIERSVSSIYPIRRQSASVPCAMGARASASGQTQTLTREAPTITKAPVREPAQTPKLDDGGPGLPPRDDGGGGGGGGGGGNWSGGFFLFGFLAFLGFLKDKESEEDYRDSRR